MRAILLLGICLQAAASHAAGQRDSTDKSIPVKSLLLQQVIVAPSGSISESETAVHQNHLMALTDKILERTPGISMIRRGNFAMEPTFRGLNNGQITLTIEGMRIFGACTDRMDPVSSYIEPNNLESISLSESPGNGAWGSNIGGGINFNLKTPSFSDSTRTFATIGTGYESNGNAFQLLTNMEMSGKKLALLVNGIFRRSGNYSAHGGREINFSQYRKWNGNASAIFKTGADGYIKADYIQDEGFDIGYPALTMDVAFAKAKIAALSYHYSNAAQQASWETKVYYNYIDHSMDDTKRPPETVPMHMDMPGTSQTLGAFSNYSVRLGPRHKLSAGIDGFHNKLNAEMTMYPPDGSPMFMYTLAGPARSSIGVNVSDVFSVTEKFSVRPGLRVEYLHDYITGKEEKEQLSGVFEGSLTNNRILSNASIGINLAPASAWTLSAELSRAARASTLQESYAFYIYNRPDGYDYIGNPSLKQETSYNLSYSTVYHHARFSAELNIYSYFIRNYITGQRLNDYSTMTIGANGVKQYINIPSARIYGSEFAFRWSPVDHLRFSTVNSFTRGTDDEKDALPMIAPFKSVNAVTYSSGKTILQGEAISNAPQNHVNQAKYGETRTPGSTIINLSASRIIPLPSARIVKVSVAVENLFDKSYFQHLDILKISRPGRNFILRTSINL